MVHFGIPSELEETDEVELLNFWLDRLKEDFGFMFVAETEGPAMDVVSESSGDIGRLGLSDDDL